MKANERRGANYKLTAVSQKLGATFEQMIALLPPNLRNGFRKNAYLAGGCIYSLYHLREPHDYDFFVKSPKFAKKLLKHFQKHTHANEDDVIKSGRYKGLPLTISRYAITIGRFQIIVKHVGDVNDVVAKFDFLHNMFAFKDGVIVNFADWGVLERKELIFNEARATDICGVVLRISKFTQRGMTISRGELRKILLALKETGFNEDERGVLDRNAEFGGETDEY